MTKEKGKRKAWRNLKVVAAASNSQTFQSPPNKKGPSSFLLLAGRGLPHTTYSRAKIQAKQTKPTNKYYQCQS